MNHAKGELKTKRDLKILRFLNMLMWEHANEVTVGGFCTNHAKGELKTKRDHKILRFLSPCW